MTTTQPVRAQLIFDADNIRAADDPFRDDRMIDMQVRQQNRFVPSGLRIGATTIYPELTLLQEYDDNLFGSSEGNAQDMRLAFQPRIAIVGNNPSNQFRLTGQFTFNRHLRFTQENTDAFSGNLETRTVTSRGYSVEFISAYGRYAEDRADRFATVTNAQPVIFTRFQARANIRKTAGRLLAIVSMEALDYDYRDGRLRSDRSVILPESQRSRQEYRPSVETEYAFSPDTAIFTSFRYNRQVYKAPAGNLSIQRDTSGFELGAGVRFKLTPVIEFTAATGYLEQYYAAPLLAAKGISTEAEIKWLPTLLTSVEASFSRKIEDGGSLAFGSRFVNETEVSIDHELRRHLILNFLGRQENYKLAQADRHISRLFLETGAVWRLSPLIAIHGRYQFLDQSAGKRFKDQSFHQSRFTFSLKITA
ncbi:outer membrane beta-barrel protein [Parasphingorhabdus halotolerans]|uniref:Outer membrane beta-barrel protein n=1 Tax=Parasphingorhabdus halotolerans TaxID=2725558 RepID=A0A6H2DNY5_9SPHN|nr:outer membrane beta-barrel protein [Parasphingorhabdus halotolerans]QJB69693.1 outer membrane beta-barrel protein [Parasphingorhabdus halotolerans]